MSQDIITYKQKVVIVPDEKDLAKTYNDDNLGLIIKVLRKGPMTVNDLVEEFEKKGIKKSDKSIYRYLKELIELKFVARAGKRIRSINEKDLQSETIYIRTAKLFLTGSLKHKSEKIGAENIEDLYEVVFALLKQKYGERITSTKGIKNLLNNFDETKEKLTIELLENANKENLKKVSELNWDLIGYMLEYASWLALILELDVNEEIEKCCPK
jgi:hypothetical protein